MKTKYKTTFTILTLVLLISVVYADNTTILYGQNSTGDINVLRIFIFPVEF